MKLYLKKITLNKEDVETIYIIRYSTNDQKRLLNLERYFISLDIGITLSFYAVTIKRMSITTEKHENGPHCRHILMS